MFMSYLHRVESVVILTTTTPDTMKQIYADLVNVIGLLTAIIMPPAATYVVQRNV